MKIAVYQKYNTIRELEFCSASPDGRQEEASNTFLGYIDLPIEKQKKTVTKEVLVSRNKYLRDNYHTFIGEVPDDATNFRLLFDVKE